MHLLSISKITAISMLAAALTLTTGCAPKRHHNSEVVVSPLGIPGNGVYGNATYGDATGALVNNSEGVQAAAANIHGVVYFAFDSSAVDTQAQSVLNEQIEFLAANPEARVLIAGHADERGSREYNHALGERRAQAVKAYLAANGINDARVETLSYGEERPAVQGSSEEAYAQNRRAELSY